MGAHIHLKIDGRVPYLIRENLARQAVEMYYLDIESYKIKEEEIEGRIYTKGEHASIGGFAGQVFHAEVETNTGRANLSFIISSRCRKNTSLN